MGYKFQGVKVLEIRENIFFVLYESQFDMNAAFMRISQFSESPNRTTKNKFLSSIEIQKKWFDYYGAMDFHSFWVGHNIPGTIFKKWFNKPHSFYESYELQLWDLVMKKAKNRKKFYVITHFIHKDGIQKDVLEHEISHAFWHLNPEYRRKQMELNKKLSKKNRKVLESFMATRYAPHVFEDEIHAYLATSEIKWIEKTFPGVSIKTINKYRQNFLECFEKDKQQR